MSEGRINLEEMSHLVLGDSELFEKGVSTSQKCSYAKQFYNALYHLTLTATTYTRGY